MMIMGDDDDDPSKNMFYAICRKDQNKNSSLKIRNYVLVLDSRDFI